jgi:hypothetical protein
VSLNLTRPARTPLPTVFAFVRREAARYDVRGAYSEIIGAIPEAALGGVPPEAICWRDYSPAQVLETWLGSAEGNGAFLLQDLGDGGGEHRGIVADNVGLVDEVP